MGSSSDRRRPRRHGAGGRGRRFASLRVAPIMFPDCRRCVQAGRRSGRMRDHAAVQPHPRRTDGLLCPAAERVPRAHRGAVLVAGWQPTSVQTEPNPPRAATMGPPGVQIAECSGRVDDARAEIPCRTGSRRRNAGRWAGRLNRSSKRPPQPRVRREGEAREHSRQIRRPAAGRASAGPAL